MKNKLIPLIFIFFIVVTALLYFLLSDEAVLFYLFKPDQSYIEEFVKEKTETGKKMGSVKKQQQLKEGEKISGVVVDWRKKQEDGVLYYNSMPVYIKDCELGDYVLVKIIGFTATGKSARAEVEKKYANYANQGSIDELVVNQNYTVTVSGPNSGGEYFALYPDGGKLIIIEADRAGEKMVVKYVGMRGVRKTKYPTAIIIQRNIIK